MGMFQDGKEATAKCGSCGVVKRGVTHKVKFFTVHLCTDCVRVLRDALDGWLQRLGA